MGLHRGALHIAEGFRRPPRGTANRKKGQAHTAVGPKRADERATPPPRGADCAAADRATPMAPLPRGLPHTRPLPNSLSAVPRELPCLEGCHAKRHTLVAHRRQGVARGAAQKLQPYPAKRLGLLSNARKLFLI